MDDDPFLKASRNVATSFCDMAGFRANLASMSALEKQYESCFISTVNDFKLRKEWNLTFNKSGTKERT